MYSLHCAKYIYFLRGSYTAFLLKVTANGDIEDGLKEVVFTYTEMLIQSQQNNSQCLSGREFY